MVLNIANRDKRIEAVLLNGSRANPDVPKDDFQDYDIVFVTSFIDSLSFGKLDKDILQYITDKDQLLKILSNKSLKDIEGNLRFMLDEINQMAKYISINRKLNLNKGEYQSSMKFMNNVLTNSYQDFN